MENLFYNTFINKNLHHLEIDLENQDQFSFQGRRAMLRAIRDKKIEQEMDEGLLKQLEGSVDFEMEDINQLRQLNRLGIDIFESDGDLEPSTIGIRDGIQKHDRDRLEGMTGPIRDDGNGNESVVTLRRQARIGQFEPDLPIDDTLPTTPTITATQTMSGSLWGLGPFEYRLGYTHTYTNSFEYRLGYTHTFTKSLDLEGPPFYGDPPLGDPGSSTDPPAPANIGPGAPPAKEVQEPESNTGSTGEQKKGGK